MARPGVTYQNIADAAQQLQKNGRQPTIELIRQSLGTGSSTTIANHLRQWRMDQGGATHISSVRENLPQELMAMVQGLWDRLNQLSQDKISELEATHQQVISDMQQDLHKYKTNNQRWQQLLTQWTREKEQLVADKKKLEQAVSALQKENASLQMRQEVQSEQLQERQARIEELRQLHAQIQANLEHDRKSHREQRLAEQQQFAQHKHELHLEIKAHKEQLAGETDKVNQIQQQYKTLQQTCAILEKNCTHHEATIKNQQQQLKALDMWENQCKAAQKAQDEKTIKLIDSQAENKALLQQLADLKQSVVQLQQLNALLAQEKWELAQEKAQIEGQMQQLQKTVRA